MKGYDLFQSQRWEQKSFVPNVMESAINSYFSSKGPIIRLFFVFLSHRVFFPNKERKAAMNEFEYNTQVKRLILPEYGRHVQQMVDHCVSLPTKEERTVCAYSIVNLMGNMFPHLRDVNDFKHKLWDHLAIMSDFELDIDYPYEITRKDDLYAKPTRIPYPSVRIRYRHYGRFIEGMIKKAMEFPEGEEKTFLIALLANQMKKNFLIWNKDSVDDQKIFDDLKDYSHGEISLDQRFVKLIGNREGVPSGVNNNNFRKRRNIPGGRI